jgi:hypothetical protein
LKGFPELEKVVNVLFQLVMHCEQNKVFTAAVAVGVSQPRKPHFDPDNTQFWVSATTKQSLQAHLAPSRGCDR